MIVKVRNLIKDDIKLKKILQKRNASAITLKALPEEEITEILRKRKEVLDYKISQNELSGTMPAGR